MLLYIDRGVYTPLVFYKNISVTAPDSFIDDIAVVFNNRDSIISSLK